jgi:hypothetical protein
MTRRAASPPPLSGRRRERSRFARGRVLLGRARNQQKCRAARDAELDGLNPPAPGRGVGGGSNRESPPAARTDGAFAATTR